MKRIVVTGGAGQIAYSLLFRIAKGELLGDTPIALHLFDLPEAISALKGVKMELDDCAYPLLKEVRIGSDPKELFADADYIFLVGAKPRSKGMERKDLLTDNGKIFVDQGKAINEVASKEVRVLVVGNPCNTNCLICMYHAPDIDQSQFFAMTRLDQNRAVYQLANKAGVNIEDVTQMTIWGNHSSTQVPDFTNALIQGKDVTDIITDTKWLEEDFFQIVQKRGASIIDARGKSSAASAANAALDSMRAIIQDTPWFSAAICSKANPYGIDEELIFSFPLESFDGGLGIIPDLSWNAFIEKKIKETEKELMDERDLVRDLLR